MSWDKNRVGEGSDTAADPMLQDAVLDEALKSFRQSVQAWGESAGSRQRTVTYVPARRSWRLAAGWALGCALVAGTLSGGVFDLQRRDHQRSLAAARLASDEAAAKAQQLAAEQHAQVADDDLLATVDSDISRTVPAAMEPLAQLMDEDQSQSTGQ